MLRLVELVLFLSPFAAFLAWRLLAPRRGPPPGLLALLAVVVALLAGGLIWYSRREMLPSNATYAPAQFENGRLIPSRGARP